MEIIGFKYYIISLQLGMYLSHCFKYCSCIYVAFTWVTIAVAEC